MSPPAACVIIADRHPAILRALKRILEPQFEVVGMVDNIISLIDALDASQPDAIVIDIAMHAENGDHLARHLAQKHPMIPVVLIGDDSDGDSAPPKAKGCAFVPKSRTVDLLQPAVAKAVRDAAKREHRET